MFGNSNHAEVVSHLLGVASLIMAFENSPTIVNAALLVSMTVIIALFHYFKQ